MPSFESQLLTGLEAAAPLASARLCVAFSGGLDSTALLHGLSCLRPSAGFALRALHVNHGLHADAGKWAEHCLRVCDDLGVQCEARTVVVARAEGQGLEAAARVARYGIFTAELAAGEWLLTAHHEDDQLETLLLHLTRGSGVTGLAGIPRSSTFGAGHLLRPLLGVSRRTLVEQVRQAGLSWLEDPSNCDSRLDRNYLRREVIPRLRARWPAIARSAGRSAALAAEAAELLEQQAAADAAIVMDGRRIPVPAFRDLGDTRRRNLIRYLARRRGWSTPPEARLRAGLAQLLGAAADRAPVVRWPGGEIRRYRDHLYLVDEGEVPTAGDTRPRHWDPALPIVFEAPRGRLRLVDSPGAGLAANVVRGGLVVGFAGEGGNRSTLKHVFQRFGVVPWMRPHVPLVRAAGELVAVGDLWIAAAARAKAGEPAFAIVWEDHAPVS